jgi:hypothetical protein
LNPWFSKVDLKLASLVPNGNFCCRKVVSLPPASAWFCQVRLCQVTPASCAIDGGRELATSGWSRIATTNIDPDGLQMNSAAIAKPKVASSPKPTRTNHRDQGRFIV